MAINYSNDARTVKISLKDAYNAKTVFGNNITDGTLEIGSNDAALFKLTKAQV